MKLPILTLAISYVIFFACLFATISALPAQMATHFDIAGRADGWMGRDGYLEFICGMAIGLPLFMIAITAITGRIGRGLNIPNRQYWLAPERRAATVAIVMRFVIVLAAAVVLLHACLHLLVVSANSGENPHFNSDGTIAMAIAFLGVTAVWTVVLYRRFCRMG